MPLLDQIQKDMVASMKAREEAKLNTIRMIKAALQKFQIDSMKPLDEATEMQVLNTIAAAMSETGIASAKQMGLVMNAAKAKLAGKRVDGKALSDRIRAKLT